MNAIICEEEGKAADVLKKKPELANCTLLNDITNPICWACYLERKNMINLLLSYGADIN